MTDSTMTPDEALAVVSCGGYDGDSDTFQLARTTLAAHIEAQRVRVEELEGEVREMARSLDANWVQHQRVVAAEAKVAELEAVVGRLREDGERLDWLSDADNAIEIGVSGIGIGASPAAMRARIDAARSALRGGEES